MSEEKKLLGQSLFSKLTHHHFTPVSFTYVKEQYLSNSEKVNHYTSCSFFGKEENMPLLLESLTPEEKTIELEPEFGPQRGHQCPNLQVFASLFGDLVDLIFDAEDPTVYVIDFRATWCGPCQEHIAHNQKMIEDNPNWQSNVKIMWISLDDSTVEANKSIEDKSWGKVKSFWAGPGGSDSEVAKKFKVDGIPKCFIVKNGSILWIGHPSDRNLAEDINMLLEISDINSCKTIFDEAPKSDTKTDPIPLPEAEHDAKMQELSSRCSEFFRPIKFPSDLDMVSVYTYTLTPTSQSDRRRIHVTGILFTKNKEQGDRFISRISEIFPEPNNRIRFEESTVIERGEICSLCARVLDSAETQYLCVHCSPRHYHCQECQQRPREGRGSARLAHPHPVYRIHRDAENLDEIRFGPQRVKFAMVLEDEPENCTHTGQSCDNYPDTEVNCLESIVGTRYKCAHCRDFDFCQTCGERWSENPTESMISKANASRHLQTHVFIMIPFP